MSDNRSSNRGGGVKLPSKRNKIISIALVLMLSLTVLVVVDDNSFSVADNPVREHYTGHASIGGDKIISWDPALPDNSGISYDNSPETPVLTLDNAEITVPHWAGTNSDRFIVSSSDFIVRLSGENKMDVASDLIAITFFAGGAYMPSNNITFIGDDASKDSLKITAHGTSSTKYSMYFASGANITVINCSIDFDFEFTGTNTENVGAGIFSPAGDFVCDNSVIKIKTNDVPNDNDDNSYYGISATGGDCTITNSNITIDFGASKGSEPSFGLKVQLNKYSITNTNLDIKVADSKVGVNSSAIIVNDGSAVPLSTFSYAKSVKGSTTHGAALTEITGDITSEYRDIYVEYASPNAPAADNSLAITAAIVASVALLVLTFFIVLLSRRRREDD